MRIRLAKKIIKRPWRYTHGQHRAAWYRVGLGQQFDRALATMIGAMERILWQAGPTDAKPYWTK